jgi:hypothetical protein
LGSRRAAEAVRMSGNGARQLSKAELAQRRAAPLTHGGYSAIQIRAKARAHRRRFLRQAGLRASDLDAIAGGYLDGWARALAKVDLFDTDEGRTGELREYFAALNSARLWLAKLDARLSELGLQLAKGRRPGEAARRHVAERYGSDS